MMQALLADPRCAAVEDLSLTTLDGAARTASLPSNV
jgi:hypothetical protein